MNAAIALLQWFNEAVLRPTAVVLDVSVRTPRALYFGFRAAAVELGANPALASIISGFIVTGLILSLLWTIVRIARRLRNKSPGPASIRAGAILSWLGLAMGIYFLGVTFYIIAFPSIPFEVVGFSVGTAIFYPAAGRGIRYLLGG
jgi:hypothetical protein